MRPLAAGSHGRLSFANKRVCPPEPGEFQWSSLKRYPASSAHMSAGALPDFPLSRSMDLPTDSHSLSTYPAQLRVSPAPAYHHRRPAAGGNNRLIVPCVVEFSSSRSTSCVSSRETRWRTLPERSFGTKSTRGAPPLVEA